MKSNRAVGNAFEQELCQILFDNGYWSHNLKQDNSGQPADVIAVRNKVAYLIDCKDCSKGYFDLCRVEENQITAMDLWESCGNGQGCFALRISDNIRMITKRQMIGAMASRSRLSEKEIYEISLSLERWVAKCK